jgi:hypothetical protein
MTKEKFYALMSQNKELVGDLMFYKPLVCKDGFAMSVQASKKHYCNPKEDSLTEYTHYEVGFPSDEPNYFKEYAVVNDYTKTVYPFVPVDFVVAEINHHGGVEKDEQ